MRRLLRNIQVLSTTPGAPEKSCFGIFVRAAAPFLLWQKIERDFLHGSDPLQFEAHEVFMKYAG